jgi:putative DNA primase/helicase
VLGLFPGQLLFVPEWGWLAFNGRYWERQGAEALAVRRVTEALRMRQAVAVEKGLDELAQASAANSYTVSGVLSQLRSLVTVGVDEFDAHPDHINCANGVVSLQTGEVVGHEPRWRFMWCIEANYVPERAAAPVWHKFVWESVYNGDDADSKAVLFWLRDALGYGLTGHTSEELFLYLFGPSRSGKGTLTQTLLHMLGRPVSREVKMDMFYNSGRPDTQNFHLAPLVDARLVVASETSRHQRLDPALLKGLTGGDEIYASNKGKDHFNFKPRFQLMMSSNWPLNMDSDDDAAWESRVRVVPFPNSKVGAEDKSLKDRLLEPENLEGVLAWLVAGAMNWYRHGRKLKAQPESMVAARQAMRNEQDLVGIWLAEETDVADPTAEGVFTPLDLITKNYGDWCKVNGLRAKGRSALVTTLEMKGFAKAKRRHPLYDNPRAGFVGVKLAGVGADTQKELGVG